MLKITTKDFIERANNIHGYRYDYRLVKYVNTNIKVIIICPIHGRFEQRPNIHLGGAHCQKCMVEKRKSNIKRFIRKAKIKHKGFYSYKNAVYVDAMAKIKIDCPIHGEFEQIPNNHLRGAGCPQCGYLLNIKNRTGKFQKLTTEEVIKRSNIKHNYFYTYPNTLYVNWLTKIRIECPIHGEFKQLADSHLAGHGCPKCTTASWDLLEFYKTDLKGHELGHLYQLKIYNDEEVFWKVGITRNTIKRRYGNRINDYNYTIIDDFLLKNIEAARIEYKIHNDNRDLKYVPKDTAWGGFSECYERQINILCKESENCCNSN